MIAHLFRECLRNIMELIRDGSGLLWDIYFANESRIFSDISVLYFTLQIKGLLRMKSLIWWCYALHGWDLISIAIKITFMITLANLGRERPTISLWLISRSGARLNIKISSYRYMNSHNKDNTVPRLSYLYNGNPHTLKYCLYISTGPWGLSSRSCLRTTMHVNSINHWYASAEKDDIECGSYFTRRTSKI